MHIKFIENGKKFICLSIVMVSIAIGALVFKGLNYGIDFSGGNLFQVKYEKEINLNEINNALDKLKDIHQMNATSRKVQVSEGNVVIVRSQELSEAEKQEVIGALQSVGNCSVDKAEKVGASVGKELKSSAIYALGIGAVLIIIYITLRFEFVFAIGAILALLHDIVIAVGVIALLGYEVNTPFIAAVLTILGYSINDTIVLYDRIRENLRNRRRTKWSIEETFNNSMNQVVTRSINTSLTTLFAVLAVLVFGGISLRTFIVTLLVGMIVGTYSSLFIAAPLVYYMSRNKKSLEKFDEDEEEEQEDKILV